MTGDLVCLFGRVTHPVSCEDLWLMAFSYLFHGCRHYSCLYVTLTRKNLFWAFSRNVSSSNLLLEISSMVLIKSWTDAIVIFGGFLHWHSVYVCVCERDRMGESVFAWVRWIKYHRVVMPVTQSTLQNQPKCFSRQRNGTFLNGQVSHMISAQYACFSVIKYKTKYRNTH